MVGIFFSETTVMHTHTASYILDTPLHCSSTLRRHLTQCLAPVAFTPPTTNHRVQWSINQRSVGRSGRGERMRKEQMSKSKSTSHITFIFLWITWFLAQADAHCGGESSIASRLLVSGWKFGPKRLIKTQDWWSCQSWVHSHSSLYYCWQWGKEAGGWSFRWPFRVEVKANFWRNPMWTIF